MPKTYGGKTGLNRVGKGWGHVSERGQGGVSFGTCGEGWVVGVGQGPVCVS